MKAKKAYFITILILLAILSIIIWSYLNSDNEVVNNVQEIVPEEEISDEQLRNTIVNIYYLNKDTGNIESEGKVVDVKELLVEPYQTLLKMWIDGPKSSKLKNNCSKNIKINNTKLEGDCVVVDLSSELINEFNGTNDEAVKNIYCIVNTLTELNEVNSVRILVDGEENKYLGDFNLSQKYVRLNN